MKLTLKTKSTLFFNCIVHAIYLVFRSPEIFFGGRYFAEEGAIWWSYSLQNSFLIHYIRQFQQDIYALL